MYRRTTDTLLYTLKYKQEMKIAIVFFHSTMQIFDYDETRSTDFDKFTFICESQNSITNP